MELNAVFPSLNTMWVRWSAYEITDDHGVRYLMPAPGAEPLTYNCAAQPETLIADALELGHQLALQVDDADRLCAAFAARYGLLGLGAGKDARLFKTGAVVPCYRPLNEQSCGEELEQFKAALEKLYRHFCAVRGELTAAKLPNVTGGLRFKLTAGPAPRLVWEAENLLEVLRLAYAAAVSDAAAPLKICKNCGKVYYNAHAKSEFCGAKCRNYYNVGQYRRKNKYQQPCIL